MSPNGVGLYISSVIHRMEHVKPINPVEPIDPTDSVEPIDTVEPIDRVERSPRGVLEVYMTGGSDVFFWVENLHARYFFGSRDLLCIFLGLKKIRVFFGSYLRANFSFGVFVAISGSEKYSFEGG